jgi:hypothetical protein
MLLGPFSAMDIETVRQLLGSKNIQFELSLNLAHLNDPTAKKNGGRNFIRGDSNVAFFEIQDSDFPEIAAEMEKYGVVAPSDGSFELGGDENEES